MYLTLYLQNSPLAFALTCLVLGLLVGSFLNVVIHRLPIMLDREWRTQAAELEGRPAPEFERYDLVVPRSRCPHCGHLITAPENIPLLSYAWLRGRCRACGARISPRYAIIEALCGLLSGWVAWHLGYGVHTLGALFFTWSLLALAAIDIEQQLLPDKITLPLLWLGLLFNLSLSFADLRAAVLGAVAGYLSLWCVFHLFRLLTRKEGMGYGDFKLLAAIGAWLGWQQLPLVILLSAGVGALAGGSLILLRRHQAGVPIPYGPYLAAAGWIAMFWGTPLTNAYLSLSGLH
jgi:leader peptidase (prepilin peptidase) / N-methyltransferase